MTLFSEILDDFFENQSTGHIDFVDNAEDAIRIAAAGIIEEIGGPNDRLSANLYTTTQHSPVPTNAAFSEMIDYRGHIGVRAQYLGYTSLLPAVKGLRQLLHPLSFNADGSIREVFLFPRTIAQIAARQGAALVVVPEWTEQLKSMNREQQYYRAFGNREAWSRLSRFLLGYCRLTEKRRVPFFTTHDLVDHVSGFSGVVWPTLAAVAHRLRKCLERLFDEAGDPPIQTMVLPFMAGYLLDTLAQVRRPNPDNIVFVIDRLIESIDRRDISAREPGTLQRFPQKYVELIRSAFSLSSLDLSAEVPRLINAIVDEIRAGVVHDGSEIL